MNTEEKKFDRKKVWVGIIVSALLLLAIVLIANLEKLNNWFSSVLLLFRPILIGLCVAYLCNPFFCLFERKVFSRMRPPSLRRTISLICTYLTALLILALILLLIIPQLIEGIIDFAKNYNTYISSAISQINLLFARINSFAARITGNGNFLNYLNEESIRESALGFFDKKNGGFMDYLKEMDVKFLAEKIGNTLGALTDTLFGIFISLYLLSTKEKRYAQVMKLRRALFSDTVNSHITRFCTIADRSFGGFLEGKLIDSLIVGFLTYFVISILGVPYAILIATFIGVTNIIPVIGPLIGMIPSALLLLLSAPGKVIPFLLIMFVIWQIDNNIVAPKILGNNTGVSSLCVIVAITTMGSLWGFWGMLLGVPLFATALALLDSYLETRLQRKGFPSGVENYYAADAIVDPTKNAHPVTDKLAHKLEKSALRLRNKQENGESLTRGERFGLVVYRQLHKYRIITELTDVGQARFAAQEAAKAAEVEAEALFCQLHTVKEQAADDAIEETAEGNKPEQMSASEDAEADALTPHAGE